MSKLSVNLSFVVIVNIHNTPRRWVSKFLSHKWGRSEMLKYKGHTANKWQSWKRKHALASIWGGKSQPWLHSQNLFIMQSVPPCKWQEALARQPVVRLMSHVGMAWAGSRGPSSPLQQRGGTDPWHSLRSSGGGGLKWSVFMNFSTSSALCSH